MPKLFLARPSYSHYEPESDYAAKCSVGRDSQLEVHSAGFRSSMSAKNQNDHLCTCMNLGGYDYFGMLHADVAPDEGWADILIDELEKHDLDIIHAPARFKNETGITSTAIGYSSNIWMPVRRITTTELQDLPQTFDINVLREVYDAGAERLLFNTGCMVFKIGPWLGKFPGFTMYDRIVIYEGKWCAVTVSEDYVFAHWCANQGLRAGATKVTTGHFGRKQWRTDEVCGPARDAEFDRDMAKVRELEAV